MLVPKGKDLGGDLKAVPLCRSDRQTGCVVTWASYRDTARATRERPVREDRPTPGLEAGCTNPAKLGGGAAPLDPVLGFPWWRGGVAQFQPPAAGWSAKGVPVRTRFVRMPGLLSAECVRRGGFSYLSVHVNAGAARDMIDAVVGTAAIGDIAYPDWGFHVVDMAIVEGDLVRLVRRESAAWYRSDRARKKGRKFRPLMFSLRRRSAYSPRPSALKLFQGTCHNANIVICKLDAEASSA